MYTLYTCVIHFNRRTSLSTKELSNIVNLNALAIEKDKFYFFTPNCGIEIVFDHDLDHDLHIDVII